MAFTTVNHLLLPKPDPRRNTTVLTAHRNLLGNHYSPSSQKKHDTQGENARRKSDMALMCETRFKATMLLVTVVEAHVVLMWKDLLCK